LQIAKDKQSDEKNRRKKRIGASWLRKNVNGDYGKYGTFEINRFLNGEW